MKKCIPFIGGAVLFALTASAQDWPRYETYLGYTYVRANSATNIPSFSANGGSGQFAYNFDKWFGVVLDLGAVHNGNTHGVHLDTTAANFLLGPRLTLRKRSRFTPYVQTLFGGVYATTSTGVDAALLVPGVPRRGSITARRLPPFHSGPNRLCDDGKRRPGYQD